MIRMSLVSGIAAILLSSLIVSCVSPRVVDDLKKKNERCEVDNASLKKQNEELATKNNEMITELEDLRARMKGLVRDTSILGSSLSKMSKNYDQINDLYELLLRKNRELLAGNVTQTGNLMTKLQMTEADLQKREDELRLLERQLNKKKNDLDETLAQLKQREARVNELEQIIADKDKAVTDLKNRVAAALKGFEGKGLTIEQKNGKVYVSMEAKLLFASGSIKVDSKGKSALVKLAKVLENSKDVDVLVEGHTDSDKFQNTSGGIKDNWDLSVLRATAVVKIMKDNSSVDPVRLTAAGRGPYFPVDMGTSKEAKAKNRRIEVILTPDLDELFKLLESN
ncbi:MAG: OmpA family protein [Flavobacteriales bacterium]|nr:OmpA family protein [Flavobacteriales bacterium]